MTETLLTVSELRFTYKRGTSPALRIDELRILRGEAIAILGASGSGKSTLCLVLSGLAPRSVSCSFTGSVRYLDRQVAEMPADEVVRHIGIVFEDYESQLFSTSVEQELAFTLENLRVPRPQMRQKVDATLASLGMTGLGGRAPTALSAGQKQRLALEATLIAEPEVLILDRPTSNLDPQARMWLWRRCRHLGGRPRTLVLAEQDPEVLLDEDGRAVVDRVVVLDRGEIVADGPAASVLASVDLLEKAGIRPPDLAVIARAADPEVPALGRHEVSALLRSHLDGEPAPDNGDEDPPQPAAVTFSNLLVRHPGTDADALHDVSGTIGRKEFLAIVGPNGAGKTTLSKALAGLIPLAGGEITVAAGKSPARSGRALPREIGFVYQNPDHQLFAATVMEEVAYGPRNFGLPEDEVLRRVDMALAVMGLQGSRDEDPFSLGVGARQRIAIASVLVLKPDILILDEPTTGLDHRQQTDVMSHLQSLNRAGITVAFTTHNMSLVAEYATRVLVLAEGRVIYSGSAQRLFADWGLLGPAHLVAPPTVQLALDLGLRAMTPTEVLLRVARTIGS